MEVTTPIWKSSTDSWLGQPVVVVADYRSERGLHLQDPLAGQKMGVFFRSSHIGRSGQLTTHF